MAETSQKSFHSPKKAHKLSPSTPIIPQTPQTVTPRRSSRQISTPDPSDLRRSSRRSSLQFVESEKRSSRTPKSVKKGGRSKLPITPDVSEERKRKRPDEGNVVTRARVSRNANLRPKKRVYFRKVMYDGGEFAVGDDVYVKRREDASSDDEELQVEECRVCFKSGKAVMIECDDCLGGFHLKCSKPPLKEVPEGDWICQFCEAQKLGREVVLPKPPKGKKRKRTAREKLLSSDLWAAHIEKYSPLSSLAKLSVWLPIKCGKRKGINLKLECFVVHYKVSLT